MTLVYKTVYPLIRRLEDEAKKKGFLHIDTSIKNGDMFNFSCIKNGKPVFVLIRPMDSLSKSVMAFLEKFVSFGNTAVVVLLTGKQLHVTIVKNLVQLDAIWIYANDFKSGNEIDPLQLLSSEDGLAKIFSAGETQ